MRLPGPASAATALALVLGVVFVVLLTLQLRHRLRWSPWALGTLLGTVVAAGVLLAGSRRTAAVLWSANLGGRSFLALVAVGGLLVAVVLRLCRMGWLPALLVAEALVLIAAVSWAPRSGSVDWSAPNTAALRACFTDDGTWGTHGRYGVLYDALPNVVLYVPLGMALAAVLPRHRWLALGAGLLVTTATESYQALFTDRQCTGNDVLTNLAGTAVGVAFVLALEAVAGRRTSS